MFGGRRRHHHGGYHRRQNMALFMLFMQMARVGFDRIPPVTLCTILGQVAIFLKLFPVPPIGKICISAVNVYYKEDWWRLFSAAFFHLDEWHLYYNMISFLWKGITLERQYGSVYMAFLIAVFALLCNATTVALAFAAEAFTNDPSYLSTCAAGFSGVIFALKVVTTHLTPPGTSYVMGFLPVPSRYACWAELLAIQIIVPNASFLGHLAGILVGLAFVKGPLSSFMDTVAGFITSLFNPPAAAFGAGGGGGGRNRFSGGGQSTGTRGQGGTTRRSPQGNTGAQEEEEELQEAIRRSLRERYDVPGSSSQPAPSAPSSSLYPDLSDPPSSPPSSHESSTLPGSHSTLPGSYSNTQSPTLPPRYRDPPEAPSESPPESPPYPTHTPSHPMPSASPYPDHPPPPYPGNVGSGSGLSREELRRRRLEKLGA